MFTYDESDTLSPMSQVAGKTIKAVIPSDDSPAPQVWIIEFTDGERVGLYAHYDDSEVFWRKPRFEPKASESRALTKEEMLAQFLDLTCRAGELVGQISESGYSQAEILEHLRAAQALALTTQYLREQKTANWVSGLVKWIPK